jgi:poly-gamma-glutamate synthesis protein (capsule biosynthesis protein)
MNIAFVGDITPGGVFTYEGGVGKEVLDYLHSFDLRIGTLESAFGDGSVLCHIKMRTPKLATCVFSPDEMVKMLQDMHINAVSLANNHSCDCDLEGLYNTIDILDKAGIAHFGAGHNDEEASAPAILRHNDKTVCLLGYLQEYEYLYRGIGYHPSDKVGGLNIYSLDKAITDIKKYKSQYDYVFVLPHWGLERSPYPLYDEVRDARRMIEAGADGVIGSHAHIVQPTIDYKGGIIAMNLGNFAFPDRYITPPRLTYYPSEEEREKPIPVIRSFKKVDKVSLKIVAKPERLGAVLAISVSENGISYKTKYTNLTDRNYIEFCDVPSSYVNRDVFIGKLVRNKMYFLLWLLNFRKKLPYYIVGMLNTIRRK